MKTYKTRKNFPIYAGMENGKTADRIHKVGVKTIEFTYDSAEKDCLIAEKEVKRIIY